jgi:hypothetical protein
MANTNVYGFTGLRDYYGQRISQIPTEVVTTAILEATGEYNRMVNAMMALLVERTTVAKQRYNLPTGGTLQPLDEWGNPLPRQPSGSYEVAFPIQGGGDAWGDNRITRAKMTPEDLERYIQMVQAADADWLARHILAAIFTNTTWTYNDPNDEIGALTIQPLANGDSVTYVRRGGVASTDDHYLAQAAAIDNSNNPFITIKNELNEHPSNSGDIVAFIPTNLRTSVESLGSFLDPADPNILRGNATDVYTGPTDIGFGDEFVGYVNGVRIIEWKRLPDNYGFAISTGAPKVLKMREHPEPELQGLFPEFQDVDGNRHLNKMLRFAGFGVANRVGAVAFRIGNASYAIPSGYEAPLAV